MRSETILSIRKGRKKYFDEIKNENKAETPPVLKEEQPKKNPSKLVENNHQKFSNHVHSIKEILVKSVGNIRPIKPVQIPNPFKKQFTKISELVNSFNRRIDEFKEKVYSFLIVLFDAEDLLVVQGAGKSGFLGRVHTNPYLQDLTIKGTDYIKSHINKVTSRIFEMPNPLERVNPRNLNFSRFQKYPERVGMFIQNHSRSITSGVISFFYATEQRE